MSNVFRYCLEHIPNFRIDDKMQEALCFRERLEVFHKDSSTAKLEKIGQYFIAVESTGPRSQELFVQIFLSMTINNHLMVSKITSSATKELHCLEEKKNESFEINNASCERNVYVGNGDAGYFVRTTEKYIQNSQSEAICIPYSDTMYMSDGCSILLMRYLSMTNFCGSLSFDMITIQGKIVKCDFECSSTNMEIKNADVKVVEIIQQFCVDNQVNSTIKTILSKQGTILSIDFINSSYIVKINPHIDHYNNQQEPIILPLRETWQEDFELVSKHFDKKVLEEDGKRKYLLLHSEVNELLSDYIQSLLCKKPDDVLKFTIDYFQTLNSDENGKN